MNGMIPAVVLGTVGQVNMILGTALTLIAAYKRARDAWKAAHPGEDTPFLEDSQLIDLFQGDADGLAAHVEGLLAKHGAAVTEPAPAEPSDG